MINRYPGKCYECGARVAEGRGSVVKVDGRWTTFCARHGAGGSAPPPDTRRCLEADGTVRTPYEPDSLPVLRGAPGAKWDADAKVWRWSVDDADLARTLECAAQLRLDVAPELSDRLAAGNDVTAAADDRIAAVEARAGIALYPYQRDGVRWLAQQTRALLGDDMGLGKTIQTLCALPAADEARALVVAPASLLHNWAAECRRWRPDLTATVLRGRGACRPPAAGEVVIVSYESAPKAVTDPPQLVGRGSWTRPELRAAAGYEGVALIVDEAHRVKNRKAQRSSAVAALAKGCARAWFLTGTPLVKSPFDLWGVLSALGSAQTVFGSWSGFLRCFGGAKDRWGGYSFAGPNASVPERLRRVMVRRTKAEVLPDLPAKTRRTLTVPLGTAKELRAELAATLETWSDVLEAGTLPPFEAMSRVRALLSAARVEATLELVEEYEAQSEPLIVFSAYRAAVDTLAEREGWASITGDTPAECRQEIVDAFQAGELRGVALTIAAGGVGLTLTRASNVLFVDRAWNPADNIQAEDRAHRIGQRSAVTVTILESEHLLDRRVGELLEAKVRLIEGAIEGRTEVSAETAAKYAADAQARAEAAANEARRLREIAAEDESAAALAEAEALANLLDRETKRAAGAARPTPAPKEVPTSAYPAIVAALRRLQGQCDGAQDRDGAGFAKSDVALGWRLAATLEVTDDPRVYAVAERLLSRYRWTQLDGGPGVWDSDDEPAAEAAQ